MKKDRYMLKYALTMYGVSLLTIGIGLNELIKYRNNAVMSKTSLEVGLAFSIVFLFLHVVIFRDEVELGKMKKSMRNFVIGFAPALTSVIFNLFNFIFLIDKI